VTGENDHRLLLVEGPFEIAGFYSRLLKRRFALRASRIRPIPPAFSHPAVVVDGLAQVGGMNGLGRKRALIMSIAVELSA
jgi:hypothetical protein